MERQIRFKWMRKKYSFFESDVYKMGLMKCGHFALDEKTGGIIFTPCPGKFAICIRALRELAAQGFITDIAVISRSKEAVEGE